MAFGEPPGVPPGTTFTDRRALAEAGVHRALQAGICGRADEGAESVVVSGYRYDGLYRVEDYWPDIGIDGFRVWRFRLVKLPAQGVVAEPSGSYEVRRQTATVSRVVRDTAVTREAKALYGFRCQVCGVRLDTPPGPYAEAAHIRPLGRPHDGPDALANVLCLCPNHHIQFDRWAFALADDLSLIGLDGRLHRHAKHALDLEHVRYHRRLFEAAAA